MRRGLNTPSIIALAIANAIVLLLVCYFADNWRFSILTGPSVGQRIEQVKELAGVAEDRIPQDYVFINTAYDRELSPVYDDYGLPEGVTAITDRAALASFISQLDNQHKYVMMDVLLSDQFHSPADSALIAAILNTDRIGIARSKGTPLIDDSLIPKAGFTDYSTDIYETSFVKYEFVNSGNETLPYKAFLSENPGGGISSYGPFHFHNGKAAWKSLTLRFPIKLWTVSKPGGDAMEEKIILNLGADILDMGIDIPALVKDKIVVMGDFREDDIHDTYLGRIAGPAINVNALEALRNNEIEIPVWLIALLLALYSVVSFFNFRPQSFAKLSDKWLNKILSKSQLLRYLLSFAGYSFLFTIFAAIIYLLAGYDVNVLIPSLWFTILSGILRYYRSSRPKEGNNEKD